MRKRAPAIDEQQAKRSKRAPGGPKMSPKCLPKGSGLGLRRRFFSDLGCHFLGEASLLVPMYQMYQGFKDSWYQSINITRTLGDNRLRFYAFHRFYQRPLRSLVTPTRGVGGQLFLLVRIFVDVSFCFQEAGFDGDASPFGLHRISSID